VGPCGSGKDFTISPTLDHRSLYTIIFQQSTCICEIRQRCCFSTRRCMVQPPWGPVRPYSDIQDQQYIWSPPPFQILGPRHEKCFKMHRFEYEFSKIIPRTPPVIMQQPWKVGVLVPQIFFPESTLRVRAVHSLSASRPSSPRLYNRGCAPVSTFTTSTSSLTMVKRLSSVHTFMHSTY